MSFHLVQVNVAVAKYDYDDERFADFVNNLDRINGLGADSSGFVWLYQAEDETAAGKDVFGDERLLFNMSMWQSKESLMEFVYKSDHVKILRRRAEWFTPMDGPGLALWWQPAGTIPTVVEAKHRLELLAQTGPTQDAFTFRHFFESPDTSEAASVG